MGMGSLLPEGQMNMMPGPGGAFGIGAPAPSENPWIAASGSSGGVPLMPVNPPGPFGPGPSNSVSQGGDLVCVFFFFVWNLQ